MTRILYWNIEKFSLKKILDNGTPMSQDRCKHILNEVIAPHSPDMIIIVEVKGKVAEIKGVQGCPFRGVCYLWVSCCKQVAGGERREPGFAG